MASAFRRKEGAGASRPSLLEVITMGLRVLVLTTALSLAPVLSSPVNAQLGARPVDEWIKTLDGRQRVASLRIPDVVAALKIQPGQAVADIGAGTGLLEVPLAKAVGPRGKVFAVDIDAGFFPEIKKRAAEGEVSNVQTVLGKFADPALPAKNIDLALFHDVIHHIESRAGYLRALAGYLGPKGRIAVVDFERSKGPHEGRPELQVSREDLVRWARDAGFVQVEDIRMFDDKYFLMFERR